jgi:hypothetical protein
MAPFYLIGDDELLKSQLLNLNYQTDKSFEVVIPDPHYPKRAWLSEFVKTLQYNIVHFPYIVNPNVPKTFDYGLFNNAVLMSSTNKIITFQDWRFCHPRIIKILKMVDNFKFVGFNWQVLYKDDCLGLEPRRMNPIKSNEHSKSTIPISIEDANVLYRDGKFNDLPWESTRVNTFHNSCWGHYCINKDLWLAVNGIDEVATNTRHYADLDLNTRLQEYFRVKKLVIEIPMIKNVMVRMMHDKGQYFGGSNIHLDFKINEDHKNCCFVNTGMMNDKAFVEYVVSKIDKKEYVKLYETKYSEDFVRSNNNYALYKNHATIGFQCLKCGLIGETPHWYEKSPNARIQSLTNIGIGKHKLGRDLNHLNVLMKNKTFEQKVNILNSF